MPYSYDVADEIDRYLASETLAPVSDDIHEIEFDFFTSTEVVRTIHGLFPAAQFWPQKNRWTLRVTDDEFAEAVQELEFLFEIYGGELVPLVFRYAHDLPPRVTEWSKAVRKLQPKPVRYQVPQGDSYNGISI